jgi:hypothetical protein|eukprot:COSAG06_NODE_4754_length_3981_cov_2.955458_3_plen_76_part_00
MLAGTSGSSHNRYLCNHATLAVRHYLAKYYNSPYVCEDCGASTKVRARALQAASSLQRLMVLPNPTYLSSALQFV